MEPNAKQEEDQFNRQVTAATYDFKQVWYCAGETCEAAFPPFCGSRIGTNHTNTLESAVESCADSSSGVFRRRLTLR